MYKYEKIVNSLPKKEKKLLSKKNVIDAGKFDDLVMTFLVKCEKKQIA